MPKKSLLLKISIFYPYETYTFYQNTIQTPFKLYKSISKR